MRYKSIQSQVTAGRFTLPVVVFICAACWLLSCFLLPELSKEPDSYALWQLVRGLQFPLWLTRAASFVLYAVIGYFLIEINNTFAIIRMRASVQTSIYFILITACPGLHLLYAGDVAALAFLISLYFLFKSYQHPQPAGLLFQSFAFIGVGSLAFPQLTFLVPIWLIGAYNFQSLTFRSLCGAVVGWSMPFWFLLGHAYYYGQMELFYSPFQELVTFVPLRFVDALPVWELITLGYLFILYAVSAIHCIVTGYKDKIRTRAYLNFLIFLCFCLFLFALLQPNHSIDVVSMLLLVVSILSAHLFVLTNSRLSNWFFIGSMVGVTLLLFFNIWTHL